MSSCKNCRFWISEECHRYPNHFYPVGGDLYFPKVAFFNWCGEWKGIPPCRCTETCKCKELKDILQKHSDRITKMRIQRYSTCNYSEFDTARDGEWTKACDTKLLEDENETLKNMLARLIVLYYEPRGTRDYIRSRYCLDDAMLDAEKLLKGERL